MTKNEKIVREVHPRATIERQKTYGGQVYYLVREAYGAHMYIGSGDTRAEAWAAAAATVAKRAATGAPQEGA